MRAPAVSEGELRCLADALEAMLELLDEGKYDKVRILLESWRDEVMVWLERDTR